MAEKPLGCFEPAENFEMVKRTWPVYGMQGVIHLHADYAALRIFQQLKAFSKELWPGSSAVFQNLSLIEPIFH